MRIVKIQSKSNPKIFREVRITDGLDGKKIYQCSCPANVWWRVLNGRRGKENCRHIKEVKLKMIYKKKHPKLLKQEVFMDM